MISFNLSLCFSLICSRCFKFPGIYGTDLVYLSMNFLKALSSSVNVSGKVFTNDNKLPYLLFKTNSGNGLYIRFELVLLWFCIDRLGWCHKLIYPAFSSILRSMLTKWGELIIGRLCFFRIFIILLIKRIAWTVASYNRASSIHFKPFTYMLFMAPMFAWITPYKPFFHLLWLYLSLGPITDIWINTCKRY